MMSGAWTEIARWPFDDPREVRVVWTRPARWDELDAVLDPGERLRLATLPRADDRRRFVAVRALARLVLSQVTGVPAQSIAFTARCPRCGGEHGQPRAPVAPHVHLSMSHAGDRAAVAITALGPVGLDVEPANVTFGGFADVALTENERVAYRQLPAESRPRAAATWWVRKEALLKATGYGLLVPPEQVEISGPAGAPELIRWGADLELTDPARLADLRFGADYMGCVAVLSEAAPLVRVIEVDDRLAVSATRACITTR
ncbi:MAG TPA: 4'-phosphopantetheinyl transferase superfamily protein [Jatrophihabitantaceae bacterium]|jgi:4'-phosphopantetheinyl transferase